MPPDPLTQPIAALTDHAVLSAASEADLIETMLAGKHARAVLPHTPPAVQAAALDQARLGEHARDVLVRHNLRLVVSRAKRYLPLAGQSLTLDDLVSFGSFGLLKALDKFDPAKTGKLSTYAIWWIDQAIRRGIAEEGRVVALPVHLHERLSHQRRAYARLVQQLGREPTTEELGIEMDLKPEKVAQLGVVSQEIASLNALVRDTDRGVEIGDLIPDERYDPEEETLSTALRRDLDDAMQRLLTERERRFVQAYFGFDSGQRLTLDEVGAQENLTRERVRQVIKGALAKLGEDCSIAAYRELLG
jgi:RNA polymerase primary sigma factor